ncbi:bifunctional 3-deoxy-7-phosphoheptulonate synthase/chorismate mutase type II [soil metagenome]
MSTTKKSLDILPRSAWTGDQNKPILIAGPCSAESEEQVLETAHAISKIPGVTAYRAGIWKPRTRPNSFEGIGLQGLKWLKKVKEETGLRTACEVANANHVYEALKHGVDILWIGARTTVNPFTVQEIADALRGVDVPVLVKNPVNPDLQLWLGAFERLNQAGIRQLGAIHRGFSTFENGPYRNLPKWTSLIEFKRLLPEVPIICDPSHIAGNRELLLPISQKAIDMALDGLMIETHCNPAVALSDAAQQVTPAALQELLNSLQYRHEEVENAPNVEYLEELRDQLDHLDNETLEIFGRRAKISRKIGEYKKANNITILQVKRWDQLLGDRLERARRDGLEEQFVKDLFDVVHKYSIEMQNKIMNETVEQVPAEK